METLWQDIKYGARMLAKSPGFAVVAVLTLALGIGANTAIFSVANSILLRPFPYRDADRLAVIWETSPRQGWSRINPSGPNYLDYRNQSTSFEDLAILEPGTGTVTGFGEPRQFAGARVSNNYLRVLGIRPMLGRDFLTQEGWGDRVSIISHRLWERLTGRDPNIIGKRVMTDGLSYTVIGVLPPDFWSPVPTDALVPWNDEDLLNQDRMSHRFVVIGHLKPGVTPAAATAELTVIEQRIASQFSRMAGWEAAVLPLHDSLVANVRIGLWMLLGSVALVLLIACANLANLILARAVNRARELAVRAALGAGRSRLIGQFLTESIVLAVVGGALGLMLALWGVDLLERVVPATIAIGAGGEVLRPPIVVDTTVLLFTMGLSLATGLLFGTAPAFTVSRVNLNNALKEGGRSQSLGGRRLHDVLAASEVALALVLLNGTALTLQGFWQLHQVDPGFHPQKVLAMEMELPTDSKYRTPPEQADFFRRLLERVATLPSVNGAGVTSVLPLDPAQNDNAQFSIEGRPLLAEGALLPAEYRAVSPAYFATLGIPLLQGRGFEASDTADRPAVAVISESLARRYFADLDPVGQRLVFGRGPREIVGVVADVRHAGLGHDAQPTIYTAYLQSPEPRMTLVVQTGVEPLSLAASVKSAVYSVDKDQPVYKVRTMEQVVAASLSTSRFTLVLLSVFAAAAVSLAAVGIYGVISYGVSQRVREIGIRMALGARQQSILSMVLRKGMALACAGIAAGFLFAWAAAGVLSGKLEDMGAPSAPVLLLVALLLAGIAFWAVLIPARRATKVDPMVALRYE